MDNSNERKPFFYDITLRDGNQALKKPWNTEQKEVIFKELVKLGVQAVEVGFSGSSDMDFEACHHLAGISPDNIIVVIILVSPYKSCSLVYFSADGFKFYRNCEICQLNRLIDAKREMITHTFGTFLSECFSVTRT